MRIRNRVAHPLMPGTKLFSGDNMLANVAVNTTVRDGTTSLDSLLFFPVSWYPLRRWNQIIIRWYLTTLPTAATFVRLTMCSVESMLYQTSNVFNPGWTLADLPNFAFARLEFDEFLIGVSGDNSAGTVAPHPFRLSKTVVDPSVTISGQSYRRGTRWAIPVEEDFICFHVETDGTDNTGQHSVFAEVGWA